MEYQKINETTYQKSCGYLTTTLYKSVEHIPMILKQNGILVTRKVKTNLIRRRVQLTECGTIICDFRENRLNSSFEYYLNKYKEKNCRRDYA